MRKRLDWDPTGRRVRIYRNLHAQAWSVLAMEGPHAGRVVAHADSATLDVARFIVSKAGRARVLREKRKNVHAYVDGILRATPTDPLGLLPLTYNPYKGPHFEVRGGSWHGPLHGAEVVHFDDHGKIHGIGLRSLGPSFGGTWA
jgi:hypothetical protein